MSDCRFGVSPVNYPDPDPEIAIKAYFHFSHYKSVEKVVIATKATEQQQKNILIVEANVMNISAKFQLHPPMASQRR